MRQTTKINGIKPKGQGKSSALDQSIGERLIPKALIINWLN